MATKVPASKFLAKGGKGPTVGQVSSKAKVSTAGKSSPGMMMNKKEAMAAGGRRNTLAGRSK